MAIRDVAKEIDNWEELDKPQRNWWKAEFEKHYPQKMLNTTFLLMFGHLEEMLLLLHKSFNPEKAGFDFKEKGIKKFKLYIKSLLGDRLTNYQHILDAQLVRNSLIHCAGRVSLMDNKVKLEKAIRRSPDCYGVDNDRVLVKLEGLVQMQKSIHGLTNELLSKSIQPTPSTTAD